MRRARIIAGDTGLVTFDVVERLYSLVECVYCHNVIEREDRSIDHIIPLSRGGLHHPENLTMACISCNSKKRASLTWATQQK